MGTDNVLRLETNPDDNHWEMYYRRGGIEGMRSEWDRDCQSLPEDVGDYEEPWDDIGRRERMAEAMYEC